jgi:hypothetical protein
VLDRKANIGTDVLQTLGADTQVDWVDILEQGSKVWRKRMELFNTFAQGAGETAQRGRNVVTRRLRQRVIRLYGNDQFSECRYAAGIERRCRVAAWMEKWSDTRWYCRLE